MIRIKMLCNWQSSKSLCDEWFNMCNKDYCYENIQITWEDNNIDYYIIINYPHKDDFYVPSKTIVFQMEPSVAYKNWGEWAYLDESTFLYVASHKNHLNAVQLQLKSIPTHFPIRKDRVLSILSEKNHDIGHIKRINLIRLLENNICIDIYGRENYHSFKNYKGCVNNSKEECFSMYKYCFQAENNSEYNYATEKIWEAICCECLCFYWGCPNLETYINPLAFVRLDLDDIEGTRSIIEKAIREDWWSERISIIRQEKEKIIKELGFFPSVKKILGI